MSVSEHREGGAGHDEDNFSADIVGFMFSKKVLPVIVLLVGVVLVRLYTANISGAPAPTEVKSVSVVRPTAGPLEVNLALPGGLEAVEQAGLNAHISGYIKKLYVDEGEDVQKGRILAEIDAPDVVDEYHKAESDLRLKTVTRERYLRLLEGGVISQQEFDVIDSAHAEAKARFSTARAGVGYTKIIAPFAGSIARRYKYEGDYISPGTNGEGSPIFLIVNEKRLRAVVNVPQSEVSKVKSGGRAEVRVDSYPGQNFKGVVSRLDALLDDATKTQRVLIDIKNDGDKLRAGMFVSIILQIDRKENAITLPNDVVESDGDKKFIYVFQDGRAAKVFVTTGIVQGDMVEILSGVKAGDEAIRRGVVLLNDKEPVKIISKDAAGAGR